MKKSLFATLIFTAFCGNVSASPVALRGYGEVEAFFAPDIARFACKDGQSAKTVYAKLIRDIQGCAAGVPRTPYKVGVKGTDVYAVSGPTEEHVENLAKKLGLETPAAEEYPNYLDYFDLKALKFYARPMDSLYGLGVENHWPFAKKTGIEGFVFHGIDFSETTGPNSYSFLPWDYGIKDAELNGGMVTLSPQFAGMMPKWFFERHPENAR